MTKRAIAHHFHEAERIALEMIEGMARQILRTHPCLDEFVMAMGSAFFTVKGDPRENIDTSERAYMKRLDDLLNEWDTFLHLTGTPMRFTSDGPIITDW